MRRVAKLNWSVIANVLIYVFVSGSVSAQSDSITFNDSLHQELMEMKQKEQALRGMLDSVRTNFGKDSEELAALWQKIHCTDSLNTVNLRMIVNKYGWPGNSLVGSDGSRAAFLLLQHSDMDSTIQEDFLPLITESAEEGECEWQYVAYLTDRILVFRKGKEQLYGTQLRFNEESQIWEPFPIKNEESVDERRKEVGLFWLCSVKCVILF